MDIVEQMRSFESDHEPDGWPAVTMGQVSALCDEVERLRADIATACNNIPVAFAPHEKKGENLIASINNWRNHVVENTVSLTNIANKFEESSIRYFSERNKLRDEIDRSQSLLNGMASEVDRLQSLLEQERQESLTSSCRVAALEMELDSATSIIDAANAQPVCEVVQLNQDRYLSLTCVGAVKPKVGDKLYARQIPAQQSPAVAVPDGWVIKRATKGRTLVWPPGCIPIEIPETSDDFATEYLGKLCDEILTAPSPSITEQDALPAGYREEWKRNVMLMWSCVRKHDSSIPSDVLDYMREQLLDKLNEAKHD